MNLIHRGDIYFANLNPVVGSEQGGIRPVLVIQNDVGNKYSKTIIAAAITSQTNKNILPTHIEISGRDAGLIKKSIVLSEQIFTLDRKRLGKKLGELDENTMRKVDKAIHLSLGLSLVN